MNKLLLISLILFTMNEPLTIDFGKDKTDAWFSVNDGVMGGRSQGVTSYTENSLFFEGSVSFENNGGFASIRSDYEVMDLSSFETVTVRYRCKGQSLALNFNYYQRWWYPNYKAELPDTDWKWETLTLPLNKLKEYRIGERTGNKISTEKLERIIRLGLMTNDKKEGPFEAEVDFIRFE